MSTQFIGSFSPDGAVGVTVCLRGGLLQTGGNVDGYKFNFTGKVVSDEGGVIKASGLTILGGVRSAPGKGQAVLTIEGRYFSLDLSLAAGVPGYHVEGEQSIPVA